jgi:hypothetical protein
MFRFFSKNSRLRYSALGILLLIVILGALFLALNVLDIGENYKLSLPTNLLNVIFIAVPAVPLVYFSAKLYITTGATEILALGSAQMVLGLSSVIRIWLDNTSWWIPVTLYESAGVLAALIYVLGGITVVTSPTTAALKPAFQKWAAGLSYGGITIIFSIITLLGIKNILPLAITLNAREIQLQDIMQTTATLLLFIASFIFFKVFLKSRTDFSYWYLLGLLSLAFGSFFMSQDNVESKLVWSGRIAEYFGIICFLLSVNTYYRSHKTKMQII